MIKQCFYVTLLTSSGVSDTQVAKVILESLANYGLMDTEIIVKEDSPHPAVFGKSFHLESGITLMDLATRKPNKACTGRLSPLAGEGLKIESKPSTW